MEVLTMVGGAVLATLFDSLLADLKSDQLLNYARKKRVSKELRKWEQTLRTVKQVLEVAEEQQRTDEHVKSWFNDLQSLAYDVEDILDEFNTKAKIESGAGISKVKKMIRSSIASLSFVSTVGIKDVSERLENIRERMELFKLSENGRNIQVKEVGKTSLTSCVVNEADVFGRRRDHNSILDQLKVEGGDGRVPVIPIVGMGGLGKTTLAQMVYHDASLEFDFKAWVTVGEPFDVRSVTTAIMQQLGGDQPEDFSSLQVRLKEKLSGKKALIVLDDLWNEDYEDWTSFYKPFRTGTPGSRIIVTTRSRSVSKITSKNDGYDLHGLSSGDCVSILANHALERKDFSEHEHLKELGELIASKCDGLPLAAKALGGVLRGELKTSYWEGILRSKIWEESNIVLPALKLSYYHLPSLSKRCFNYTAIFPKDYEFDKTQLVLLWIGEGFVKNIKDGCTVFDDLVARSFFQKTSTDGSVFVMHDLINDLARSVSGDICFNLDEEAEKSYMEVRHSAFTCRRFELASRFERFREMKRLRTFMALKKPYRLCFISLTVLDMILERLRYLRVLVLPYAITELPPSVDCLKHLRCLDVSYANIETLPEFLCKLFNLRVLILFGCEKLRELPKDFCNLINLHCLDIRGTDNLKEMPSGIAEMKNLHIIGKIVVGRSDGVRVVELLKIPNLQIGLHVSALQNAVNVEDVACWKMTKFEGIDELILEWSNKFDDSRNEKNEEEVLSALKPQVNITELLIKQYGGRKLPSWIGEPLFDKMKILKFYNCHNVASLPALGELPSLEKLTLQGMYGIKEVGMSFYGKVPTSGYVFPSLKILRFENMEELYEWSNHSIDEGRGRHVFPKLKKLELNNCPKLEVFSLSFPNLDELVVEGCKEVVLRSSSNLASLTKLRIVEITGLKRLNGAFLQGLGSLHILNISKCKELEWLVEEDEENFPPNLQQLSVVGCGKLEQLPNQLHRLTSLTVLEVLECPKLETFPSRGLTYSVKEVMIWNCRSLLRLPDSITVDDGGQQKSQIEKLRIIGCEALNLPSNVGFPNSLRELEITSSLFQSLKLQKSLSNLTCLNIRFCMNLESFADSIPIPTLSELTLSHCQKLKCFPNHMNQFTSLQTLVLSDCPEIASFSERGLPTNLKKLDIINCLKLERKVMLEQCLNSLTGLESLKIIAGGGGLNDVISFPDHSLMLPTSLNYLFISGFQNLKSITSHIQTLTCLETLWIWECPKLQSLPTLPSSIGRLEIRKCPLLEKYCKKGTILASIPLFNFHD